MYNSLAKLIGVVFLASFFVNVNTVYAESNGEQSADSYWADENIYTPEYSDFLKSHPSFDKISPNEASDDPERRFSSGEDWTLEKAYSPEWRSLIQQASPYSEQNIATFDRQISKSLGDLINEDVKVSDCNEFLERYKPTTFGPEDIAIAKRLVNLKERALIRKGVCLKLRQSVGDETYASVNSEYMIDEEGSIYKDHSGYFAIAKRGEKQKNAAERNCRQLLATAKASSEQIESFGIKIDKQTCDVVMPTATKNSEAAVKNSTAHEPKEEKAEIKTDKEKKIDSRTEKQKRKDEMRKAFGNLFNGFGR